MYNKVKDAIAQGTAIPVETTHTFQGQEADTVAVVLGNVPNKSAELVTNKHYFFSAITRAKKTLIIVNIMKDAIDINQLN